MTVPWFAVDATIRRSEKMTSLPSDTARYGWIVALGEAKLLYRQGTFTPGQWVEMMGRHARCLDGYLKAGLIHRAPNFCDEARQKVCLRGRGPFPDGTLVVHDWPRHQREHSLRQGKYRDAHSDAESDVQSDDTTDSGTRALSLSPVDSPLSSEASGGVLGGEDDEPEFPALQWLGRHGCYINPGNGFHRQLVMTVERHGVNAVIGWFDRLSEAGVEDGDVKGFVFGAIDALHPKPDLRALEREDRIEETSKQRDERFRAEYERRAEMRKVMGYDE